MENKYEVKRFLEESSSLHIWKFRYISENCHQDYSYTSFYTKNFQDLWILYLIHRINL